MTLKIYNTQSRQKELFVPQDPHHPTMYVCGPTVYNLIHIGNARPAVIFDVVFRLLRQLYGKVSYARNITDIDDKIIKAAKEQNKPIETISALYAEEYDKDMESLLNLEPTVKPYATEHIGEMIAMVQTLIDKGKAYEAEGHVLFDVKAMPDYGALSRCSLDDMLDGARVEVASYKKYAGDFVLWKPSTDEDPGWDSPWGRGRPGWHLECSAMIEKHLGDTIDIHGGGRDLIFPHHENEIAQSQCAHDDKPFVKYWMHNGYINIDGEKMSKSLGNFKTVRGLLESFPGEVIRYALLSAHYRSELDFSAQLLTQSKSSLDSLYGALRKAQDVPEAGCDIRNTQAFAHLLDDINTPMALSELHALAKQVNKLMAEDNKPLDLARAKAELLCVGAQLGLLQSDADAWFEGGLEGDVDTAEIDQLVQERHQAKLDKNYARADEIRKHLTEMGIVLEDSPSGTQWRKQ